MPIIDFAALNGDWKQREEARNQLDMGFQTYGFVYLENHSVPQRMVDDAFVWARRLFSLPLDVKLQAKHPAKNTPENHRGYIADSIEHDTQPIFDGNEIQKPRATFLERKETFEMGNPFPESEAGLNIWIPEERLPGFRAFQELWWTECIKLQQSLLRVFGDVLGLQDEDLLCRQQSRNDAHVSLIHYPSMSLAPLHSHQQRPPNAHTDIGGLTLLFQDEVGGLEIHDDSVFKPVIPKRGTVVLNVGEMLERQTNGRWKSALHQFTAPREAMMQEGFKPDCDVVDRFSIVYFGQPDPKVLINALPGCEIDGKWMPNLGDFWSDAVSSYNWLDGRLKAEFYVSKDTTEEEARATERRWDPPSTWVNVYD
ncbi:hypothetical protein G7Z17_g2804 [Cylindrodendrum hubeiense]|uniref:Fe2OG dioxygenase domain-containing protein n=1 Tax=Cylindrodendrum hubeiense TaxID=595255 RepID=A0A9P5HME6_9HYPO|nr:hypothetical protein G7Z17_g2804 [Cylindrodendrum hubeiense]